MTSRRAPFRPLITLTAAAGALAVGIALGGGPLSELDPASVVATGDPGAADGAVDGTAERNLLAAQTEYLDAFATAAAPTLYAGGLDGRQVALVVLPGADAGTVADLTEQVGTAGGTVAGRYDVGPALVDANEKSLVDALGLQLDEQLPERVVRRAAPTYVRLGQLLGAAVATTGDGATPPEGPAVTVRQSLLGAGLVDLPDGEPQLAPWVLVVLPGDGAAAALDEAILTGLLDGLAERAAGVVVAAGVASGAGGDLAAVREDPVGAEVTTVDGIESEAGRVATVLALVRRTEGRVGAFGASGSDGVLPLG